MMERPLKIKDPLCVAVSNLSKALDFPDPHEWEIIGNCIKILGPANDLTSILSGEKYPTISLIIPLVRGIQHFLNILNPCTDVGKELRSNLCNSISKKLGKFESIKEIAIAKFLGPRF